MSTTEEPAMANSSPGRGKSLINPRLQLQEDRFRFTPVKVLKPTPRIWDRKPCTPFLARSKSRKVWKRFCSSFGNMKALQQLITAHDQDELHTEINTARAGDYMRDVKRRCLVHDTESEEDEKPSRGRSFLETKWESEASGKRRKSPSGYLRIWLFAGLVCGEGSELFAGKLPARYGLVNGSEPMMVDTRPLEANDEFTDDSALDASTSSDEILPNELDHDESSTVIPDSPTRLADSAAYPRTLHGLQSGMNGATTDINEPENVDQAPILSPESESPEADDLTCAEEQDGHAALSAIMTDDQPSALLEPITTVESQNVPETDATEPPTTTPDAGADLTVEQESTLVRSALRSSLDGEDAELLNNFLSKAKAKREAKAAEAAAAAAAMPTESVEEKLDQEDMGIEIPTPQGRRILEDLDTNSPSPQKAQLSPTKAPGKDLDENEGQLPASPRRSTRTRNVKPPTRLTTTATAARNTLTLRRAKGNEFVFLKRTEAQELSLATRRNTRQNKGDALLPKYMLQAIAQQTPESDDDKAADDSSRQRESAKRVSWNDKRLVEYEGESGEASGDNVSGKDEQAKNSDQKRATSSRTTRSQGSLKTGADTTPAVPTTAATTATPRARRMRRLGTPKPTAAFDTTASPPPTSANQPEKRKKLTPKSPKTTLDGTASKAAGNKESTAAGTAKSSLLRAQAGSTPMPRRVRSRP
ncbi:hypothetical protein BDV25DRAFT_163259 [Aspergillus avenaceus]|uniref:Uncharacterized protein n=1 Tax=Aspergillus avenaceus TaxID=36643 RepID=A0A5N6TI64_ASPAV|nr:hypothetical protein BDV25DRAFT_163259 [Aspergillus avenaceus]